MLPPQVTDLIDTLHARDVDTRCALIRRRAPRGLVLLFPPDGRQLHTIPARDRIAVI